MYESLTVTDVARILRASADIANTASQRPTVTVYELVMVAFLECLALGAEEVNRENQKTIETPEDRNA